MSIHELRSHFNDSCFLIEVDLFKLEKITDFHLPPGDVPAHLKKQLAIHRALWEEIEQATDPHITKQLPYTRLQ